ncbi:hypothetical protein [Enterobacter mori]|uniref:hypothetical protein n=1 Tax=Enterobacter mori TaxID=539813 RepID=UPI003B843544
MKKCIFAFTVLTCLFSVTANSTNKEAELKPLALEVMQEVKNIAEDARQLRKSDNPPFSQRELNLRVIALKEKAAPLGDVYTRPYGRCGADSLVNSVHGFIDVMAGSESDTKFWLNMYNISVADCQYQLDGKDKPHPNVRPVEMDPVQL